MTDIEIKYNREYIKEYMRKYLSNMTDDGLKLSKPRGKIK